MTQMRPKHARSGNINTAAGADEEVPDQRDAQSAISVMNNQQQDNAIRRLAIGAFDAWRIHET